MPDKQSQIPIRNEKVIEMLLKDDEDSVEVTEVKPSKRPKNKIIDLIDENPEINL